MKHLVLFGAAALLSAVASAARPVEWTNLDPAHHLAGRMASSGYLRGKVVFVDCRDYGQTNDVEALQRLQEAWTTFKMKPFVLVGAHHGAAKSEEVGNVAKRFGLTYPIYEDVEMVRPDDEEEKKEEDPNRERTGFVYIIDCTGRMLYVGRDDRRAVGVIASALMAMRSPQTPKNWRRYINFDIDVLPGRAYNEIEDYRKAFPTEAAEYDAVWKRFNDDKEIVRLAKLERLTLQAKDYDFKDTSARRLNGDKVELAITTYSDLKASKNSAVSQEAKNCIAELTWALATLKDGK